MNYTLTIYRLDVQGLRYEKLRQIDNFYNLEYETKLSAIGAAIFDMDIHDAQASRANFIPGRTLLQIKRDNDTVWFGVLWLVAGNYEGVDGVISFTFFGIESLLRTRYTGSRVDYVQQDQSSITWNLINTVQSRANGYLGINNNAPSTSILRDRTYQYAEIYQSIADMHDNINGFDFSFDPVVNATGDVISVNYNLYYPVRGKIRDDLAPYRVGNNGNVLSYGFSFDNDFYNTFTLVGAGEGTPLTSTASDSALQIAYGRRERVVKLSSIEVQSTLNERATTLLNNNSFPLYQIRLQQKPQTAPFLGTYELGDIVPIDLRVENGSDLAAINSRGRITALNISVDDLGTEYIQPSIELINQ